MAPPRPPGFGESSTGWTSDFRTFGSEPRGSVIDSLRGFLRDASPEQLRAWSDSVPRLQQEVGEIVEVDAAAASFAAILEYELPLESRRPDAILLLRSGVLVIEFKGRLDARDADIDQADAYARDLRCYHAACEGRDIVPVLVPTRMRGYGGRQRGVHVCGPDALDMLVARLEQGRQDPPIDVRAFLSAEAYRPLPTLVRAARELFHDRGRLRRVHRAAAATDGATTLVSEIVHEAARTRTRRLVLLTGVPGAGKTLVGLRLVHSHFIDDLAAPRTGGQPTAPAIFLSGNGPLVEVLQYELRDAGGGGRVFVRNVKDYVKAHARGRVPAEHVIVFDEAQRAYDAAMVADKHGIPLAEAHSEPDIFVGLGCRIPEWGVLVGLIGSGQEIHKGEEAGLRQWAQAIASAADGAGWVVHGPPSVAGVFAGLRFEPHRALSLDVTLRSHLAGDVHRFVAGLVEGAAPDDLAMLAEGIEAAGFKSYVTRDRALAEDYLRERYRDHGDARFGLLASSRDRDLARFGVANDFQSTKRVRFGPWYADGEDVEGGRSCRHLRDCVTEFGAQGLELDAALVAWGTDFVRRDGAWSIERMARYQRKGAPVQDPARLRANSYRVLLTRARDANVVFVPPLGELDETCAYLRAAGFRELRPASA
ncbi:MAG: DUF2075 domain-containing protein [Alphaproteobacteria bacterium]|nr:DUF2075 domain-containing protein [Alphaproteobacteria bacterium]